MRKRIFSLLILLPLVSCEELKSYFFSAPTPIDPCDPVSNMYEGRKHYIDRRFVKEDGTLDYDLWFQAREVQYSECDPLQEEKEREQKGKESVKNPEKQPGDRMGGQAE